MTDIPPSKRKIKLTAERDFSAHHMLINSARVSLDGARNKRLGSYYDLLVVMTMSALALEAIANTLGKRLFDNWDEFERKTTKEKLKRLCCKLNVPYDGDTDPWKSALWLIGFRNEIVHGKPVFLKDEKVVPQADYNDLDSLPLHSPIEQKVSIENAERAYQTTTQIMEVLFTQMPPEKTLGLWADSSISQASLEF